MDDEDDEVDVVDVDNEVIIPINVLCMRDLN